MNNNKLRRIILEELSRVQPTAPYRRAQKLGLMDYLGESSDRHLLELDDSTVISTGMSINEQDLDDEFNISDAGEAYNPMDLEQEIVPPPAGPSPETETETEPETEDDPGAEAPDEETVADDSPADGTIPDIVTPPPPITGDGDPDGADSDGSPEDVTTDADDGSGPERDVDGPGDFPSAPPVEIPTDEDLEQDTLNAGVIAYIDNISTSGDPAGTSESRSRPIGTSLLKLLYHD
jgi:hypothetical protein